MKNDERKVRLYPLAVNEDGLGGYVTACRLSCAQDYAKDMGLTLAQDAEERAEDEDEMGECDRCAYPNPAYCEDLSDEEDHIPSDERQYHGQPKCGTCKGAGVVRLEDGTEDACSDCP